MEKFQWICVVERTEIAAEKLVCIVFEYLNGVCALLVFACSIPENEYALHFILLLHSIIFRVWCTYIVGLLLLLFFFFIFYGMKIWKVEFNARVKKRKKQRRMAMIDEEFPIPIKYLRFSIVRARYRDILFLSSFVPRFSKPQWEDR